MIGPRWRIRWNVGVCSWGIAGRSAKMAVGEARRSPAGSLAGLSIHEAAARCADRISTLWCMSAANLGNDKKRLQYTNPRGPGC